MPLAYIVATLLGTILAFFVSTQSIKKLQDTSQPTWSIKRIGKKRYISLYGMPIQVVLLLNLAIWLGSLALISLLFL